jgi:hypothetical protein
MIKKKQYKLMKIANSMQVDYNYQYEKYKKKLSEKYVE